MKSTLIYVLQSGTIAKVMLKIKRKKKRKFHSSHAMVFTEYTIQTTVTKLSAFHATVSKCKFKNIDDKRKNCELYALWNTTELLQSLASESSFFHGPCFLEEHFFHMCHVERYMNMNVISSIRARYDAKEI